MITYEDLAEINFFKGNGPKILRARMGFVYFLCYEEEGWPKFSLQPQSDGLWLLQAHIPKTGGIGTYTWGDRIIIRPSKTFLLL